MSRVNRRVMVAKRLAKAYLLSVSSAGTPEVRVYSKRPTLFIRAAERSVEIGAALTGGRVAYRHSRDAQGRNVVSFVGSGPVLDLVVDLANSRGHLVEVVG